MISYRLKQNMTVPTIEFTLKTKRPLEFDNTVGLRGFFGRHFSEDILFHNHDNDSLLYSYPRIQYKVIENRACIIGLAEGFKAVKNLPYFGSVTLGHEDVIITSMDCLEKQSNIGISNGQQTYLFLTPWLALNEKNYDKYQRLGSWAKRKELLEKILIGNIISMSKSLGYTVPGSIEASIGELKEVQTSLKGTPMLGFLGTFSVNFSIPDYWGIGKSVSRGFGTVKKIGE